jgi:hypothetical protein
LEARKGRRTLHVEVKGLSGHAAVVEVTPNEYKAMITRRQSYQLCIVSDALAVDRATLRIFSYDLHRKAWVSGEIETLNISERVAARISVKQLRTR